MRSCFRIPRVYLPRNDFDKWAVPACDSHAHDRFYWERVTRERADAPSALSCIFPDVYIGNEDEARRAELRESMYSALEEGRLERLNRGFLLVARETSNGSRKGILACVDLEEFSPEADKNFIIRALKETLPEIVNSRYEARRDAVLEFPHSVMIYRDKRNKILRLLAEDELEQVYDFQTTFHQRIQGFYIPDFISDEVAEALLDRADPCFGVVDGNHSLAAAKRHWEEIKSKPTSFEQRNHPARFALVEFVNIADDAVVFAPIHRRLKDVETEAFCEYFAKAIKCKREENVLQPAVSGADGFKKVDSVIADFLKKSGGVLEYVSGKPEALARGDCAVVALPPVEKEEVLAALKAGKRFPAKSFTLGEEGDARLCLEGREISYD